MSVVFVSFFFVRRSYADNRVARIYAGTNEIMKIVIAHGLFKDLLKNERYFKQTLLFRL
jgi:alkylation response protein AidB-like acyl-CoA dehydrogenase